MGTVLRPVSSASLSRQPGARGLFENQPAGNGELVDVGDVCRGLAADALGRDLLDVAEPHIGIEPALCGFAPQLADAGRPRVAGREGEQACPRAANYCPRWGEYFGLLRMPGIRRSRSMFLPRVPAAGTCCSHGFEASQRSVTFLRQGPKISLPANTLLR